MVLHFHILAHKYQTRISLTDTLADNNVELVTVVKSFTAEAFADLSDNDCSYFLQNRSAKKVKFLFKQTQKMADT